MNSFPYSCVFFRVDYFEAAIAENGIILLSLEIFDEFKIIFRHVYFQSSSFNFLVDTQKKKSIWTLERL